MGSPLPFEALFIFLEMEEANMKIGIVGSDFVGATAAYAMIMQGIGREIVLIDRNEKKAGSEANDLFHAVPFSNPLQIKKGRYADLRDKIRLFPVPNGGLKLFISSKGCDQQPSHNCPVCRHSGQAVRD
jgi:hypothetical protein